MLLYDILGHNIDIMMMFYPLTSVTLTLMLTHCIPVSVK